MKKSLLCSVLLAVMLLSCIPGALAMSTQEKEDSYAAAILQLEAYLESDQHAPGDLEPILFAFEQLQRFEQSHFFKYYVTVLMRVEKNEFDSITDVYLEMLDNDGFNEAVKNLSSSIRPTGELTAYVRGRECEYKGDTAKAFEYYAECLSFFDASERYRVLKSAEIENTYQEAMAFFHAGEFQKAYDLFLTISRYNDSEIYLKYLEAELAHVWTEADCEHPRTCTHCGKTEGEPLGHDWQAATCTEPKTCARCGKTEGKALGHNWKDATCTEPQRCVRCGAVGGEALGHDWQAGTGGALKTCKRCQATTVDPVKTIAVGGEYTFGSFPQTELGKNGTPVQWIVLEMQENRALLISKYGLDARPYAANEENVTWENCSLREWLNGEFLNQAFTAEEQKAILLTEVDNSQQQGQDDSAGGGNSTRDQVFLLSFAEANQYFNLQPLTKNERSRAAATDYAARRGAVRSTRYTTADGDPSGFWWLRSSGNYAEVVDNDGGRSYAHVLREEGMVRPALWLDLKAVGF